MPRELNIRLQVKLESPGNNFYFTTVIFLVERKDEKDMRYLVVNILLIIGTVTYSGCRRGNVHANKAKGKDFTAYRTYAWLPVEDTVGGRNVLDNEILLENIRHEVNNQLQARGMVIDTRNPDVLLNAHTNFERRQEILTSPLYSGLSLGYPGLFYGPVHPLYPGWGWGNMGFLRYDVQQTYFTEGTIVVDMIDRSTNQLVWRGWSETRIDRPRRFERRLSRNIERIFNEFPVEARN